MTDRSARLLRRRTTERVIGGVAGGLGDYFNIDPLLVRIGIVGLIIFGGAGIVLYLIAWLLLPAEGHDASIVESFFRRLGLTPRRIVGIVMVAAVLVFFLAAMNNGVGLMDVAFGSGERSVGLWAIAIIVGGAWLLRRREPASVLAGAPGTDAGALAVPRAPAVPRPRSPLGWYVVAAALIATGLLAIVSQLADVEVGPGQFFGAALTVIGIGLVVGAWWGRARVLILLALLLLPIAVPASFISAPLEGGVGDLRYTPVTRAELRDDYRLVGGRLVLDLTQLKVLDEPMQIAVSVALGEVIVLLPPGASVQLDARVGAGATYVFDSQQVGTSLVDRYVRRHLYAPSFILDLEAGIGAVQVFTQGPD